MSLPDFLAALLIFVVLPAMVVMAVMLKRRSRARPTLRLLRADTLATRWLVAVVAVHAVIYLNNGMTEPILEPYWTMVISRTAMNSLGIPVANWLWIYRPRRP